MIKSYSEAIRNALDEILEKDKRVILIGEDIGVFGGAFGVTKGLFKKYGKERVIDMPMSEQAITGFSIGASLNGLKPIMEIMFMDFITLIYDQLLNHASIFSYLSGGKLKVPLVIRVPAGAGRGYGATHSKTLIAPLMHIPGIKIVAPSNPNDAAALLKSAVDEESLVIFVEHKLLYSDKEEMGNIIEEVPIGKGKIVKSGRDVSIITFSKMTKDCLEVANRLEKEGISVEVLDLRTIKPIDIDLIKESLKKTGRILVVEEGYSDCGVASEIISKINENCFYLLNAPPKRICTKEIPLPCSRRLEKKAIPSIEDIENAVRSIINE